MALTNSQYDEIMRSYDLIQQQNNLIHQERVDEINTKIPEFKNIENKRTSLFIAEARARLAGEKESADIDSALESLNTEKISLLKSYGFPEDYLNPIYNCNICHDTGHINGKKCSCFKNKEIKLLFKQYDMEIVLNKENFKHFSFDWYSDTITDDSEPKTPRDIARDAYNSAHAFIENIGEPGNNLLLMGNVGTGKTFLSHCIAKEAISRSFSTLGFSAPDMFDILADYAFRKNENNGDEHLIYDCDLLIIDDLGTELTNNFVSTELFHCLNYRMNHNRSTIISTNKSLEEIRELYSERVASRITGNFIIRKLAGEDIRIKKRLIGDNK